MMAKKIKLKGSVLGFSLLLLSLLLLSGITVVSVSVLERKASFATQKSVIAFQGADSGAERVLGVTYMGNSPSVALLAIGSPTANATISVLPLPGVVSIACNGATNTLTATNNAAPAYTFSVVFYKNDGTTVGCAETGWRDSVVRIRVEGFFRNTSRVVEIGIRQRI
jgi:hypothetical protein